MFIITPLEDYSILDPATNLQAIEISIDRVENEPVICRESLSLVGLSRSAVWDYAVCIIVISHTHMAYRDTSITVGSETASVNLFDGQIDKQIHINRQATLSYVTRCTYTAMLCDARVATPRNQWKSRQRQTFLLWLLSCMDNYSGLQRRHEAMWHDLNGNIHLAMIALIQPWYQYKKKPMLSYKYMSLDFWF